MSDGKSPTKSVGGAISEALYWEFTQARVARHESATKALESAIRLYLDATKSEEVIKSGPVQ